MSCICMLAFSHAFGITRTSVLSGNWSNALSWSPSGIPSSTDAVIISSGNTIVVDNSVTIKGLTVNSGGLLTFIAGQKLTINGALTVNGMVKMNGGDIAFPVASTPFVLGANSYFVWEPATNTSSGASLFVNGTENFASTSTLVIKKWYNYTTLPLGSVVAGNFGNLEINTNNSGTILEWNQNNQFQTHQILGTLTIDQGWVTLDKSGAISITTIGNIVLKTVNSYFTGFSGTAAPNFTLNTAGITNTGGTFFGIYDGKASINLNVTGNITNLGNFKLINNDGLMGPGMCNGNAALTVGGTFSQSAGDTRFIYNLYTTTSGSYNVTIGTLSLTGGIFMGHYSCHTGGATSTFTVLNDCSLNMPNTTDKFRCIGLTNLSANVNNQKMNFTVGKDLIISGNAVAEFTSVASSGDEIDSIKGNVLISGAINSFNYGSAAAAHSTNLYIGGNLAVNGGTNYLSRIPGNLTSTVNGNLTLTNGTLVAKGDKGNATLTVNGAFNQSGGKLLHHSNFSTATTDPVIIKINGDFTQSAGLINFDDCTSSTAAHSLSINGSNYNLTGPGMITRSGTAKFGSLVFGRIGITQFNRTGNSHSILQTLQYIKSGCTLNVNSGNIQLASSDSAGISFLTIQSGGTLNMNNNQIFSNALASRSAIQVDSRATIKTANPLGLYNGTTTATICSAGNLLFFLDENSVVEYNGYSNQVVTGTGVGLANSSNQKYGILRINMNSGYAYPILSNVYVRTKLELENGEFNLNANELIIESGQPSAISRTNGYIKSESTTSINRSVVTWKNLVAGVHEFPFGVNAGGYIPVKFSPNSGLGGNVSISTRATGIDNTPLPAVSSSSSTTVTLPDNYAQTQVIDRWWDITAIGFSADVTLSYLGSENTLSDSSATGKLTINQWGGSFWSQAPTSNRGITSGTGSVTVYNTGLFSTWMVSAQPPQVVTSDPVTPSGEESADDLIIKTLGPNPFSNQFSIDFDLYQDGPVTIKIADQSGKVVYNEVYTGTAGANTFNVQNLSGLLPGIYFMTMTYHGTTSSKKIVKS